MLAVTTRTSTCIGREAPTRLISPDSSARHRKFADKYQLPFTLLVDEDHAVSEQYGAWGEKKLYGKTSLGIIRSTFLIGPDGRPTGKMLDGDKWGKSTPANMSEKLTKFLAQ